MAVTFSTPQLISASSNTATANVTGLDGGKRLLIIVGCRAATAGSPSTLTVGGVSATLVNVGGTDALFGLNPAATSRFLGVYEISAAAASGLSGTQSCTITWTGADRVTMWVTELTGDDGSFVDMATGQTNGTSHTVSGLDSTASGQALFSVCQRGGTSTYVWDTSSGDEIAEGGASGCSIGIGELTLGAAGSYTSQWTATGGSGSIGVIGFVIAEAAGGTTLSLTGAEATITGTAGSVAPSSTVTLSGAEAGLAMATGSVSPALSVGLTGAEAGVLAEAGSVSPALSLDLGGEALSLALEAGSVSVDLGGSISLTLSGAELSLALEAGSVALASSIALTGAGASVLAEAGQVSPSLTVQLSGAAASILAESGTVSPALSVALGGADLGISTEAGQVSPSLSLSLTGAGVTLNLAAGTVSIAGAPVPDPIPRLSATWTPGLVLTATHTPGLRLTASWSSTQ